MASAAIERPEENPIEKIATSVYPPFGLMVHLPKSSISRGALSIFFAVPSIAQRSAFHLAPSEHS